MLIDYPSLALIRLHDDVAAVAPVISVINTGINTAAIEYDPSATAQQIADGDAVLAAFDWSDAATDVWIANQNTERKTLRDLAIQAIQDIDDFLAIPDGSITQVIIREAVQKLALHQKRIIQRLIQLD